MREREREKRGKVGRREGRYEMKSDCSIHLFCFSTAKQNSTIVLPIVCPLFKSNVTSAIALPSGSTDVVH